MKKDTFNELLASIKQVELDYGLSATVGLSMRPQLAPPPQTKVK